MLRSDHEAESTSWSDQRSGIALRRNSTDLEQSSNTLQSASVIGGRDNDFFFLFYLVNQFLGEGNLDLTRAFNVSFCIDFQLVPGNLKSQ